MRTLKESILDANFDGPQMPEMKSKEVKELFEILDRGNWKKTSLSNIPECLRSSDANFIYQRIKDYFFKISNNFETHSKFVKVYIESIQSSSTPNIHLVLYKGNRSYDHITIVKYPQGVTMIYNPDMRDDGYRHGKRALYTTKEIFDFLEWFYKTEI